MRGAMENDLHSYIQERRRGIEDVLDLSKQCLLVNEDVGVTYIQ